MNAKNQEYILLHADAEWMKDILKRVYDVLMKDSVSQDDIVTCRWLIKQALKVEKED
jgi:hypothetical protein